MKAFIAVFGIIALLIGAALVLNPPARPINFAFGQELIVKGYDGSLCAYDSAHYYEQIPTGTRVRYIEKAQDPYVIVLILEGSRAGTQAKLANYELVAK